MRGLERPCGRYGCRRGTRTGAVAASRPRVGLPGHPWRLGAPLAPRAARPSAHHRPAGAHLPAVPTDPLLAHACIPRGTLRRDASALLRSRQPASQPARSVSAAGRYACTPEGTFMPVTVLHRWCPWLLAAIRVIACRAVRCAPGPAKLMMSRTISLQRRGTGDPESAPPNSQVLMPKFWSRAMMSRTNARSFR